MQAFPASKKPANQTLIGSFSSQQANPPPALCDTRFNAGHLIKLPGFLPLAKSLLAVFLVLMQQRETANRIGEIQRRCFQMIAIDFQRLGIQKLRLVPLALLAQDIRRVAHRMGCLEQIAESPIEIAGLAVVPFRRLEIAQVSLNIRELFVEGRNQRPIFAAMALCQGIAESVPRVFRSTFLLCDAAMFE